ncbi:MAG: hypothetical protein R3F11_20160 [Verrucomicrobiales bacterium]
MDQSDQIIGSIHFATPEQYDRKAPDGRTDLYSLGCCFYFALAGGYPFDGDTLTEIMGKTLRPTPASHFTRSAPNCPSRS